MNTQMLAELGVPSGFNLAPGCSRTPPLKSEANNSFEDNMIRNQKHNNGGHADWMSWTDQLTGSE